MEIWLTHLSLIAAQQVRMDGVVKPYQSLHQVFQMMNSFTFEVMGVPSYRTLILLKIGNTTGPLLAAWELYVYKPHLMSLRH